MALADYLTVEEKKELKELKQNMWNGSSMKEIRHYEKEIHYLLDLAEKRCYTDPQRSFTSVVELKEDINISKETLPFVINVSPNSELAKSDN